MLVSGDLEQSDTAQQIYDFTLGERKEIDILVNNAGFGFRGKWCEIPIEDDIATLRLNIEAVLWLTKLFLPPMLGRGRGRLLTTASIAGFEPGPLLAVYHATKAFVVSWSEALATELEDTSISVTALCPERQTPTSFPRPGWSERALFRGRPSWPRRMSPKLVTKV